VATVEWERDAVWMESALAEAERAAGRGEVPVGALLVAAGDRLTAADGNRTLELCDPTAHAEIVVLRRAAAEIGNHRLLGATLYVTLEPCVMCVGAMIQARIERLVYGAPDPKAGAVDSLFQLAQDPRLNHRFAVRGGVLARVCGGLLRDFFRTKRAGL